MRANRSISRGFTLIEILVVVAIIAVLIAILVATVSLVRKNALKTAATSELGALRSGLAQYYSDFNRYPPSTPPFGPITAGHGASMLAEGLLGYLAGNYDGAGSGIPGMNPPDSTDFGFRLNKNAATMGGKVYGPYAPFDPKNYDATRNVFIDPWGNDIVYYVSSRSTPGINLPAPTGTIFGLSGPAGINSFFAYDDCSSATAKATGSTANPPGSPNAGLNPKGTASFFNMMNGTSLPGNSPLLPNINGPVSGSSSYLLISAGPDEIYFTVDDLVVSQ